MWNQAEGNGTNQGTTRSVLPSFVFTVTLLQDLLIIKARNPPSESPSTLPHAELLEHAVLRDILTICLTRGTTNFIWKIPYTNFNWIDKYTILWFLETKTYQKCPWYSNILFLTLMFLHILQGMLWPEFFRWYNMRHDQITIQLQEWWILREQPENHYTM